MLIILGLALLFAMIAGFAIAPRQALAAPLTFPAAAPISAGDIFLRTQPGYLAGTQGLRQFGAEAVAAYGLSHDWAFVVENFPLQYKQQRYSLLGGRHNRDTFGPSDTDVLARYTFWEQDGIGSTNRLALLGGALVPSGPSLNTDAYGLIPRTLQPATGAWGTKSGVIFSQQTLTREIDFYAGYTHHFEGGGYQFGDEYFFDASLQRRILPLRLPDIGIPTIETYGVLESNLFFDQKDQSSGTRPVFDTGGTLWQLDPGLRFVGMDWGFAALAELPAYQSVNGGGPLHKYGFLLVYRHVFFTPWHL